MLILDLEKRIAPKTRVDDYEFRFLDGSDIKQFSSQAGSDLKVDMAKLVESDSCYCFAALKNNELAAYTWFMQDTVAASYNCAGSEFQGIGILQPTDMIYLFKAFVLPEHRGQSLNRWITHLASEFFSRENIKTVITTTDLLNTAFLHSALTSGFSNIGYAGELVIRSRHFYYLPNTEQCNFKLISQAASSGS